MIFRSILIITAGFILLPANLALMVAFPGLSASHPLLEMVLSIILMSAGPALLITGCANLVIAIMRTIR